MLDERLQDSASSSFSVTPPALQRSEGTLLDQFNLHFDTLIADTPDLVPVAQRIRYQVYCVENAFEDPANYPDALEYDHFDSHSVHSLLLHRPTGDALGTVRLVLPLPDLPERSFAIQRLSTGPSLKTSRFFPLLSTAEVSRFSISRHQRRAVCAKSASEETAPLSVQMALRKNGPLMRLGLIQTLVRMSLENGITHWCAVMEPRLLRMLAAMAIHFEPIGSLVQYHGWRQPCFCNVADVLACVKRERPSFWDVLTMGGSLAY